MIVIGNWLEEARTLSHFEIAPQDWRDALGDLVPALHPGSSRVLADSPGADQVHHVMPEVIQGLLESAVRDVVISNAYIVPDGEALDWLRGQVERGVRYRILTNSLASHDVPAVNAHYKQWRRDFIEAGVELYETRPDAAVKALVVDTPPVQAAFMGLHAKAIAIDGRRVFIGSMNLDPRSWRLNSEMGVVVESEGLAADVRAAGGRDLRPENAWRVTLDDNGGMIWTAGDEVLHRQPARNFWQRVEDVFFMLLPKEVY